MQHNLIKLVSNHFGVRETNPIWKPGLLLAEVKTGWRTGQQELHGIQMVHKDKEPGRQGCGLPVVAVPALLWGAPALWRHRPKQPCLTLHQGPSHTSRPSYPAIPPNSVWIAHIYAHFTGKVNWLAFPDQQGHNSNFSPRLCLFKIFQMKIMNC